MTPEDSADSIATTAADLTAVAEEKRRAARRRFLLRSTKAGSGVLVVTLCHQRAFAKKPGLVATNVHMVSSEAQCSSLRGIFDNTPTASDSVQGAIRFKCTVNP